MRRERISGLLYENAHLQRRESKSVHAVGGLGEIRHTRIKYHSFRSLDATSKRSPADSKSPASAADSSLAGCRIVPRVSARTARVTIRSAAGVSELRIDRYPAERHR